MLQDYPKMPDPDMSDFRLFRTIFYYCSIIIFLPVVTFFMTKYFIFDGMLKLAVVPSNAYSAVTAIVVLHLALGLYIYRAYSDTGKPSKQD